jgi:hypothetical protein
MNRPATFSGTQHQTAMPTRIFRIVFDDLTGRDDITNLGH